MRSGKHFGRTLGHESNLQANRRMTRRKTAVRLIGPLAAAVALWAHTSPVSAQLTWDATPTNPSSPNDGSGNWNTTTDSNWSNGVSDSTWTNGNSATIGN